MSQIRILTLNDVRPLKEDEDDPLVTIMQDYFYVTDVLFRPRILGFIKCSPNINYRLDLKLGRLERLLKAKVLSASHPISAAPIWPARKPLEFVVFYDPYFQEAHTTLFRQLHNCDYREQVFKRYFQDARYAMRSLGACASDLVWRRALKEIELNVAGVYEEEEELQPNYEISIEKVKTNIMRTLKNWGFNMPNLDPSSSGFNVSPKFAKVVQVLNACESYGDDFRAVIFGTYTWTALQRYVSDFILSAEKGCCRDSRRHAAYAP